VVAAAAAAAVELIMALWQTGSSDVTWQLTHQYYTTDLYSVDPEAAWCARTMMNTCWNCDRMDLGVNGKAPGSWKMIVTMSLPM